LSFRPFEHFSRAALRRALLLRGELASAWFISMSQDAAFRCGLYHIFVDHQLRRADFAIATAACRYASRQPLLLLYDGYARGRHYFYRNISRTQGHFAFDQISILI